MPSYDLLALILKSVWPTFCHDGRVCVMNKRMAPLTQSSLFLKVLVDESKKVGSDPNFPGNNTSIHTYFCSHMYWASFKGTVGEDAPTMAASAADITEER